MKKYKRLSNVFDVGNLYEPVPSEVKLCDLLSDSLRGYEAFLTQEVEIEIDQLSGKVCDVLFDPAWSLCGSLHNEDI